MAYREFSPFGTKSINVRFKCDNCEGEVLSEEIGVPSPNFDAEKASDSHNENEGYAICPNCDKEFDICVNAGYADGYIEIFDIEDEDILEIIENADEYDEYIDDQIDAILSTFEFINVFNKEIDNLKSLNNSNLGNADLQRTLQKLIFSGTITCLEDYLSTTLIKEIFDNDDNFKNFVRTFKDIRNRKFTLNELYEKLEQIKDIVKKELVDVIYHDLPKVQGMYKDTLGVEFPEFGELIKIIKTRHDMVHRNGKNKEGEEIVISNQTVLTAINEVENFVNELERRIMEK